MPIIEISGWSPLIIDRTQLDKLMLEITEQVASISELGITPDQVSVMFNTGCLIQTGRKELLVKVFGLVEKPERTEAVCQRVVETVGKNLKAHTLFKDYLVEVFLTTAHPSNTWSSQ
ncbi:MAG: hypothetical protein RLY57_756 [Candidatus Parcubacteria bacterium]|jgi:hypothetical protein